MVACALLTARGELLSQKKGSAHPQSPHVFKGDGTTWHSEPGYSFVDPNSGSLTVQWKPGSGYWELGKLTRPNVIASNTERQWSPAPGYKWVRPDERHEFSVAWAPGIIYMDQDGNTFPNIVASETEGRWFPKPGYGWANIGDDGRLRDWAVVWKPGLAHEEKGVRRWPHVLATETEGSWFPEAGYNWVNLDSQGRPTDYAVRWQPGMPFLYLGKPGWPHILSSDTPDNWIPAPGYDWAVHDDNGRTIPGQFHVLSIALLERWSSYLKEIQSDIAYPNWSGPPLDLHLARGGRRPR